MLISAIFLVICAYAQDAFTQAIALTRAHQYQDARKLLEQVTEPAEPTRRVAFHRVKAAIASGLGENNVAAQEMRMALSLQPENPALLIATATAELASNELDEASQHAHSLPVSADAMILIADIEEKRGAYVEAAKAYQKAIELAPDREDVRIALALELVQHQTFRPAIDVLQQAVALFPQSARMRTLIGVAHYALGNNDLATSALVEALDRDPTLEPALRYLGEIVLESSSSPPPNVYRALCQSESPLCAAMKLRQARELDNAQLREQAIAALRQAPAESAIGHCELGRAYEWSGDWKEARGQMETCVKLQPSPSNQYRLSLIYKQLGETELARRQMLARNESLRKLSEEGARRLKTVQAFESVTK